MKQFFALFALVFFASTGAFASTAMVKALAPLERDAYDMAISRVKVRGTTAAQQLKDYAERVKGFEDGYKLSLRLAAKDFPEADDGQEVVGLARIIDVIDMITEAGGSNDHTPAESAKRDAEVRDLLFKVRDLGGLVGVESSSWSTCGVTFPGVIILDVKAKEVISISPAH